MTDSSEASARVVIPGDPGYYQARQIWNAMYTASPAEIVYCQDAQGVSSALDRLYNRKLRLLNAAA